MSAKSKKPLLIIGGVVVMAALIGYLYFASAGWTYSEGSRVGVVDKFSKKGGTFGWKTHEGELFRGVGREAWAFSVEEGPMVAKVQEAMDNTWRVKLLYRQQRQIQSWKGKTDYFIIGVERVGN